MRLLAIDTCLTACSAALVDDGRVLAARSEPMARGHQERLAPLVQEVMGKTPFDSLDRIGVTVGPGSFTGLRVGLAFAKGLGAALSIPVVGVGVLDALAAPHAGPMVAAIDARRGQVYWQGFLDGVATTAPAASLIEDVLLPEGAKLVGPGAALLGEAACVADPDPVAVARLAARADPAPPRPLYLRAPDAKLPAA